MKLHISLLLLSVVLLVSAACGDEPTPKPAPTLTMPPSPTASAMSAPTLTATPNATPVLPTPMPPTSVAPTPTATATVKQTATPAPGVAEIPLHELQKYLGSYRSEEFDVKIVIQNNRLAIDVPGQQVFELYPPDEEGKWVVRLIDEIAVEFNESDAGVESMTRHQAGQEFNMPRIDVASEPLPTVVSKPIEVLNDGSETVCSQEDYVNRVSAADHCLAIDIYTSPARTINPTLITFVHGDGLNNKGQRFINYFLRAYPDAHEEDFIFIAITRPGYSNGREPSTGQHYYFEGDAYWAHTVMAVSEAIMKLKEHYNAGRLVVMGHSGGANILANALG